MRKFLLTSSAIAALMLLAAPVSAANGRNQCYAFSIGSMQFDCSHDAVKGDPSKARRTPEPPEPPEPPDHECPDKPHGTPDGNKGEPEPEGY